MLFPVFSAREMVQVEIREDTSPDYEHKGTLILCENIFRAEGCQHNDGPIAKIARISEREDHSGRAHSALPMTE